MIRNSPVARMVRTAGRITSRYLAANPIVERISGSNGLCASFQEHDLFLDPWKHRWFNPCLKDVRGCSSRSAQLRTGRAKFRESEPPGRARGTSERYRSDTGHRRTDRAFRLRAKRRCRSSTAGCVEDRRWARDWPGGHVSLLRCHRIRVTVPAGSTDSRRSPRGTGGAGFRDAYLSAARAGRGASARRG